MYRGDVYGKTIQVPLLRRDEHDLEGIPESCRGSSQTPEMQNLRQEIHHRQKGE